VVLDRPYVDVVLQSKSLIDVVIVEEGESPALSSQVPDRARVEKMKASKLKAELEKLFLSSHGKRDILRDRQLV
jgi:hypothetical protein